MSLVSKTCPRCLRLFVTGRESKIYCSRFCQRRAMEKSYQYINAEKIRVSQHIHNKRRADGNATIRNEYRHCFICGTILFPRQIKYCRDCNVMLLEDIRKAEHEERKRYAPSIAARRRYKQKREKLVAIGRAALEMFPHLEELLNDPS
jgi:hypothetical protein